MGEAATDPGEEVDSAQLMRCATVVRQAKVKTKENRESETARRLCPRRGNIPKSQKKMKRTQLKNETHSFVGGLRGQKWGTYPSPQKATVPFYLYFVDCRPYSCSRGVPDTLRDHALVSACCCGCFSRAARGGRLLCPGHSPHNLQDTCGCASMLQHKGPNKRRA